MFYNNRSSSFPIFDRKLYFSGVKLFDSFGDLFVLTSNGKLERLTDNRSVKAISNYHVLLHDGTLLRCDCVRGACGFTTIKDYLLYEDNFTHKLDIRLVDITDSFFVDGNGVKWYCHGVMVNTDGNHASLLRKPIHGQDCVKTVSDRYFILNDKGEILFRLCKCQRIYQEDDLRYEQLPLPFRVKDISRSRDGVCVIDQEGKVNLVRFKHEVGCYNGKDAQAFPQLLGSYHEMYSLPFDNVEKIVYDENVGFTFLTKERKLVVAPNPNSLSETITCCLNGRVKDFRIFHDKIIVITENGLYLWSFRESFEPQLISIYEFIFARKNL